VTEIRTTSATGGQKGVKPERHDLVPRRAMAAIARVFGFGASKYEDHNWRKGYEWGKSLASLQRHIDEFVDGNTYDEESGLPHLAHAGFHILALLTWLEEQGEGADNPMDDRWRSAMERTRREKEAELAESREEMIDFGILTRPVTIHLSSQVSPESLALLTGQREALAHFQMDGDGEVTQNVPNGVQRSFGDVEADQATDIVTGNGIRIEDLRM